MTFHKAGYIAELKIVEINDSILTKNEMFSFDDLNCVGTYLDFSINENV